MRYVQSRLCFVCLFLLFFRYFIFSKLLISLSPCRSRFSAILDEMGIGQAPWSAVSSVVSNASLVH